MDKDIPYKNLKPFCNIFRD